jgi:RNA polymerase sigma factor for flagellar operon FliA
LAEHLGDDIESFHKKRGNASRFETFSMEVVADEVMGIADERTRQPEAIVEHAPTSCAPSPRPLRTCLSATNC